MPETAQELRDLRARIDALTSEHAALLEEHQALCARLEAKGGCVDPDPEAMSTTVKDHQPAYAPDRRQLLRRAGTLAAGAVAGGAALTVTSASPAFAAQGSFSGAPAVNAQGVGGSGVLATSDIGAAVSALCSNNSPALAATNTDPSGSGVSANGGAIGLSAISTDGTGVWAVSSTGLPLRVDNFTATTKCHLRLGTASGTGLPVPPTRNDAHIAGEIAFDTTDTLWLCTASGTPGTWRRIAGQPTAGALSLLNAPVRVYDSRPGFPPAIGTKSKLVAGIARTIDLKANGSTVPAGATGVMLSLVATGTTGAAGGFLAVYRNGIAWPGTSNVNWSGPNENVAVTTVTTVDATAMANLYANIATDVVVDVLGYFR